MAGGLRGSGSGGIGGRALARFDSRAEATSLQRIGGQALSKLYEGVSGLCAIAEWKGGVRVGVVAPEGGGDAYLRLGSDGGKLPPGTLCTKAGDIFWKPDRRTLGGEQGRREGGRAGHVQAAHLAAADDLAAVGG